ncbi:hypothetical protein VNI00_017645 [Paramarasmius palmivorus]|uniref:Uncharacterized protein n=1 Tax=Paramarasmius palmivorus TaxID=297713 RepID=A0AAW0B3T6_9AGAR
MSSTVPDGYLAYLSIQQTIILPITTLSAMYFAYGFYVLLFGTCIYMMHSRDQTGERRNNNVYIIPTVVLFVLSTIFVVNETAYYVHGAAVRFNVVENEDIDLFERYQNYDDFERRFGK